MRRPSALPRHAPPWLVALGTLALAASPAAAGANRVWVSGHGVDAAGCGAPSAPCRSLQYAHDNAVAAGGEIDILDPAGYGAVTINKAVSIVNDGVGTAGLQAASGDAVTINAGAGDVIYLKGLNIDGVGGVGANGVTFNSGARLLMADCTVQGFQHNGVNFVPTAGAPALVIVRSAMSDNAIGLHLVVSGSAVVNAVVEQAIMDGNSTGGAQLATAGASAGARITLANSQASQNGSYGIAAQGTSGSLVVEINRSQLDANASYGLLAQGVTRTHLAWSVLDQNGINGVLNTAHVFTAGDNHLDDNGSGPVGGVALSMTDVLR